jgi:hypothetical protein
MTNDEIMAMDEDALRLAVAKLHGETVLRWCDHDDDCGNVQECERYIKLNEISMDYAIDCGIFKWPCFVKWFGKHKRFEPVPDFPRDIAAAWGLVEEMKETATKHDRHDTRSGIVLQYEQHEPWGPGWVIVKTADEMGPVDVILGETAPIAICRAWLMWKAGK